MYTQWLESKNALVGNDNLRKVLRFFKYLRDIKTTFSCRSILLTTLVASQVREADRLTASTVFADLPTTLRTLMGRLDDYLQAKPKHHRVLNPVLPAEDFVRHWDDDKYENFREVMHRYREWIDDAFAEADQSTSVSKWRRVFGDEFGRGVDLEQTFVAEASLPAVVAGGLVRDAVQLVKQAGRTILARVPAALPWVQPPPFRFLSQKVSVAIRATLHSSKGGPAQQTLESGTVLSKQAWILFEAVGSQGVPFMGKDFTVQWRIVNSDRQAMEAHALRGGFYPSNTPGKRWETTLYRGVHWVEAFLVRKRDAAGIGQSARFFVVVE